MSRSKDEEAMSFDEFGALLAERFAGLSKQLKKIAQFVLDHPVETAMGTAVEIAARLEVQPSSLIRFAQALDVDGFSEIQKIFRARVVEQLPGYTASYSERIQGLRPRPDEGTAEQPAVLDVFLAANWDSLSELARDYSGDRLEEAIELIRKAHCIYVVGLRRSFPGAAYIYYSLRHMNIRAVLLDGAGGLLLEQARMIETNDVLIAVTFPSYAPEVMEVARLARENGAGVISITDRHVSPVISLSDIHFLTDKVTVSGFRTMASTMCLAQALVIGTGLARGWSD